MRRLRETRSVMCGWGERRPVIASNSARLRRDKPDLKDLQILLRQH
jgi:hypothetical protein